MSKFLKLTQILINKNFIHHININKDKIIIHLMTNEINSILLFGSGGSESYNTKVEVCKTKNLDDFKTVTDWINNDLQKNEIL